MSSSGERSEKELSTSGRSVGLKSRRSVSKESNSSKSRSRSPLTSRRQHKRRNLRHRKLNIGEFVKSFGREGARSADGKPRGNLGTLRGVYLSSVQNVFGILMFLRLPWIIGLTGVGQGLVLVFLCCLCTFLTSISISAVATNGKLGPGGPYYLISRNLGPELGCAIGLLFCLANTVAIAMYLIGGVEILLMFLLPQWMTIGGSHAFTETQFFGLMTHNFRLYASGLLLVVFLVVVAGVSFTQWFAPLSLIAVVVSIVSIFLGAFSKTFWETGSMVCLSNGVLLRSDVVLPNMSTSAEWESYCDYCTKEKLFRSFCPNNGADFLKASRCSDFLQRNLTCVPGTPGFSVDLLLDNMNSYYLENTETVQGVVGDPERDVVQDIATNFFVLLAIYFPSVTGVMTGANISGDLKKPQRSIPVGTIAAQISTSFVYLLLVLVFGGTVRGELLRDKYGRATGGDMVAALLSWPTKYLVMIGAFCSTFGAALQSLCCAPRLLQAISKDNVIPALGFFAVEMSRSFPFKETEPFRGQCALALVALLCILIGRLDTIAPLVELCFLSCYATINLSCAVASLLATPSWRPSFRFYHPLLSWLGVLLAVFLMLISHWWQSLILMAVGCAIYVYVLLRGKRTEWGDARRGLSLSSADSFLFHRHRPNKHWTPQLLVIYVNFKDNTADYLLHCAACLKAKASLPICLPSGYRQLYCFYKFNFVYDFAKVDFESTPEEISRGRENRRNYIREKILQCHLKSAYSASLVVKSSSAVPVSLSTAVDGVGLGRLKPNTLLLQTPSFIDWKSSAKQKFWGRILESRAMRHICLLIVGGRLNFSSIDKPPKREKHRNEPSCCSNAVYSSTVDVWWILDDLHVMVLLAQNLRKQEQFFSHHETQLRLFVVVRAERCDVANVEKKMKRWLKEVGLTAELNMVTLPEAELAPFILGGKQRRRSLLKDFVQVGLTHNELSRQASVVLDRAFGADVFDEEKLDRADHGKHLDLLIQEIEQRSADSELVLVNLPVDPAESSGTVSRMYLMGRLSVSLRRVILVRCGSDSHVITSFPSVT